MRGRAEYVQHVSRMWPLVRRYAFDALVVAVAVEGALEVALRQGASDAPETSAWLAVPAIALVALPLLARRRFPFAAPAGVWLLAAGFSFVDGRLIVFTASASIAGLAAAFLLGNLRDGTQAQLGLGVTVVGAALVMYNNPDHSAADLVFTPILFGVGWLAGFALRERAEQAEAAEERALQAERERETAARIAVAEERARIARELHDIVAHAVSVMVLQVGAVRHKLPETLDEDRDALQGVEQAGRTALTEMRRLLGAMRDDGDGVELAPQPGLDQPRRPGGRSRPRRAASPAAGRRRPLPAPARARPLRLPDRPGGPHELSQARPRRPRRRDRPLRRRRVADRSTRRRRRRRNE